MPHPRFCAAPSLVGSFPHAADPQNLVETILSRFTTLPAWPQLPARDWLESMYVKYSEGLPGAVVDRATERIYFRAGNGFEAQQEAFYQAVVEEDVERFAIGPDYALGLHLNVHHSFLPAFIGARPYHAAFQRGVKLIGATSHYVTAALDDSPIIEQDVMRISHRDQVEDLIKKGRDIEKSVLSRAVRWHLERRILCYGNKTVVFD